MRKWPLRGSPVQDKIKIWRERKVKGNPSSLHPPPSHEVGNIHSKKSLYSDEATDYHSSLIPTLSLAVPWG